jgi:Rrf2 family protein
MKLSRTVAYAIHAALQLALSDSGDAIPCNRLATDGKMPERFLPQILRSLVTHGILASARGIDGGYRLARDPSDISLLEVIEAVDGPFHAPFTIHPWLPAESRIKLECAFHGITDIARQELRAITLADLLPTMKGEAARKHAS